jgi:hypothetical protein
MAPNRTRAWSAGAKLWLRSAPLPVNGLCPFFGSLANAVPEIQFSYPYEQHG